MTPPPFFDDEVKRGLLLGSVVGAIVLAITLWWMPPRASAPAATVAAAPAPVIQRKLDVADASLSTDAMRLASWVVGSADNGHRPFVILDKRRAQLLVFEPGGRLIGDSPVLLGYARGDDTVPGIGDRPIESVGPEERTTPAGRFVTELGRNMLGEDVVWVDYEAAVSMHRVRLTNPAERRTERLASPTADDNRISYGCINLPVAFFEQVLWPTLREQAGVVYVLPEHKAVEKVFPGLAVRSMV